MGFRARSGPNWFLDLTLRRQVLDFQVKDILMDFTFPWLLKWLWSDQYFGSEAEWILMAQKAPGLPSCNQSPGV